MKKVIIKYLAEVVSAVAVMLWGAWLLNPFVNSFERFRSYATMAQYAGENVWGIAALLSGLCILVGLYLGNKRLRHAGLLGAIFFRVFSFVLIGVQNNFASNGTPDFMMWSLLAIYAYWNVDNG